MATPKKKPEEKPKIGRPTKYTPALALKICREVATNTDGLGKICCENPDFPAEKNIHLWRLDNVEFRQQYDAAKRIQADLLAEEIRNIADDVSNDTLIKTNRDGEEYEVCNTEWIARSRLRVDTRKWIASKLLPKVYGDAKQEEDKQDFKEALEAIKEIAKKCMKPI